VRGAKVIRIYDEDAQRLEEIRRALVMEAGGARRSIADAVRAVMLAAEPPMNWPRWPKPESNPQPPH